MKQSQRIVKNSIVGIAAGVIGGLVYLATTVVIARNSHVSIAEFGEYQWVLAFAMIAQLVADSGLPRMMIREIAKDPECVGKIIGVAAALIWFISLIVCLLVGIVALFLPYHTDVKIALVLMTFATLATFHGAGYSAVLRAFEDNELNYLGFILQKILLFVFILVTLHFRTGLIGFVVAHLLSNVLLWNFYHILVSRFYTKVKLQVDLPLWKELFLTALPMGGGVMLRQLALNIDIFVLGIMTKNMTTVGLFGGPYRLSWSLRTIPQTLSLPLYPLFSRTAHFSPGRFGEVYRQSLKFFTLISFPVATFFTVWSKPVLTLALGQRFLPALPAMQLLGLGLIPFFISTLFQYIFAALDAQKAFFGSTLIGSVLRIILLVTLIPKYNFVGPAVAFVVAEMVTVGIWIYQLQKMGYPAHIINILWRPIVAGIVMGLVLVWFLNSPLVWQLIGAVLSLLSYIAVLFAVRTFSKEEIHQAREGIAFVSPFVEAWAKKIKRNT
ncbi:MAG TPA: flippase [Candidatus Udaeobacter sp.]|jgi:O-antigen/teichoic acid export membrane protein|nr:flippase [Candidatus Udaeobacter sp.]